MQGSPLKRFQWFVLFALIVLAVFMVQNKTSFGSTEEKKTENMSRRPPAILPAYLSKEEQTDIKRNNTAGFRKTIPNSVLCSEHRHVAFIKVHKAASTTITTILQRFGYSRDLTFALPRVGPYHIGLFETFHPRNVMPIRAGAEFEILCQHVVYNNEAFHKYLPSDTQVIAAVRDPVEKFMSSFLFFPEYFRSTRKDLPPKPYSSLFLIEHFLSNPTFYEPQGFRRGSLAINRMSFDLGISKEQNKNSTYVKDYIQMLDREMTFVIISKYFDQSLVILKRKLCWSTKDILYKVQHKGYKKKPKLPAAMIVRLKELQPADFAIYEYFLQKYKTIASKEPKLKEEVIFFRSCLKKVYSFCKKVGNDILRIERSEFSESFSFNQGDCYTLNLGEVKAVERLKRKQTIKSKKFF